MTTVTVLIGLSGSGKSTIAEQIKEATERKHKPCIILSSDSIREELYRTEEEQKDPNRVLHDRAKENLRNGIDVIYDATNLTHKKRKAFLSEIQKIPSLKKQCVIVTCSFEECVKRQSERERKVPEYAIRRQMTVFEFPTMDEGWTTEPVIHNNQTLYVNLDEELEKLKGLSQKGKWHLEDAYSHSIKVWKKSKALKPDDWAFQRAARYHDIGKSYVRSEDKEGNSHFYGHEHVGSYLYTCTLPTGKVSERDARVVQLIEFHDMPWNKNKRFVSFDKQLQDDLNLLHECDQFGTLLPEDLKKISLMDFIEFFGDWKDRIQQPPFSVLVKESDGYVLLKYSQLNSDFSYRVVQECRGCILKDTAVGWQYVCRPFVKFFNRGEELAANIDWKTARTTEKIDGALMKLWFDDGKWHLSTNGTIDAFTAISMEADVSYGQVFERALGYSVKELGKYLDPKFTYMFEMTSPETRVVIPYPDGAYYLAKKETKTGREDFSSVVIPGVKYPKVYPLNNIESIVSAAKKMSKDEEGFVVNDANGHRIKIKSPEYLLAAHLSANHSLSIKKLLRAVMNGTSDDLVAYAPEYKERIDGIKQALNAYESDLEAIWEHFGKDAFSMERKEFAAYVASEPQREYVFKKLDKKGKYSAQEYIENKFALTEPAILRNVLERIGM